MRISTALLIFPTTFLCVLQLFIAILSIVSLPFALSLLFGIGGAIIISTLITQEFSEYFTVPKNKFLISLGLSVFVTFILSLRINAEIFDFTCPTGLLGLTNQVVDGHFPVSFISFPEITMNYHQGFVLLSGILTGLSELPVAIVVKGMFLTFCFLLQMSLALFFLKQNNPYYFIPSILTLTIGTIAPEFYQHFFDRSYYLSITMFGASMSSSWPLSLLLILTLILISSHYKHTEKHIVYVGLLTLTLAINNGVLFQIVVAFFLLYYLIFLFLHWRNRRELFSQNADTTISVFLILSIVPLFLPSVFLAGDTYVSPELSFALFERDIYAYIKQSINYIILTGVLPLSVLLMSLWIHPKKETAPLIKLLSLGLLFTYTLPLIFTFKGIVLWEAVHKFSYLAMFLSVILVTLYLHHYPSYRFPILGIIIVSIISTQQPSYLNYSFNFNSFVSPPDEMIDVVAYLSQHESLLIPFKTHSNLGMAISGNQSSVCEMSDSYALVAQYSGNFIRHQHYNGFLLDPTLEAEDRLIASWEDFDSKLVEVKSELDADATLLVEKQRIKKDEREMIEVRLGVMPVEFENYLLYRTKSW